MVAVIGAVALLPGCAFIQRSNVSGSGAQSVGIGGETYAVSADGRFVAFTTVAPGMVTGDTNGTWDVFVHDHGTGTTERVSVSTGGTQGNGPSDSVAATSADGRYVLFTSSASNLVGSDTNHRSDAFVRDRVAGTTTRVSVATGGGQAGAFPGSLGTYATDLSADGRYVVFVSDAPNLVAGDLNDADDVFVRDLTAGTTERVSVSSAEVESNQHSYEGFVSDDGNLVAFDSDASNLVGGDGNGASDVFLRNRSAGTTTRASLTDADAQIPTDSYLGDFSGDGSSVVFHSEGSTIVPSDTNGVSDVFVRDLGAASTQRVSLTHTGAQGTGESYWATISDDGRTVAFLSEAPNLVASDGNGSVDAFVRDRTLGRTLRVSTGMMLTEASVGADPLTRPGVSRDGRYVAFASADGSLVGGDTNGVNDIFLRFTRIPAATGAAPSPIARGATTPVTITGSGFEPGPELNTNAPGVTFANIVRVDAQTITVDVSVAPGATTGSFNIGVVNPGNPWQILDGAMALCTGCLGIS